MKYIIAVFSFIVLCTSVQAQNDENVNPVNVARAFALKSPAYFEWRLHGQALVSNTYHEVNMRFVMRKSDSAITNLQIDNVVIPLTEPIYGIPMGDGELIRNVYLYVRAFTKSGDDAGFGHLDKDYIHKDDSLEVVLRPADVRIYIPLDTSIYDPNDVQLTVDAAIYGYGYGYDSGGFYVSMPPVGGQYSYTLRRRSDGVVIGGGVIEPFKEVQTPNDAYFGIKLIGGVLGAEFQSQGFDDWIGVPSLQYSSLVTLSDGTQKYGSVIYTDVGPGGVQLIIGADVDIFVQQATENGEMPLLPLTDRSIHYEHGVNRRVYTPRNAGKVVITILPKGEKTFSPWLNIGRYYGLPSIETSQGL